MALVKCIAEEGRLFDETKFRLVNKKEKIYEFKPLAERFFNFFWEGKKIIIINACHKTGQKLDWKAMARAVKYKKDYELRVKDESYYAKY